jgi:hypothetical protein
VTVLSSSGVRGADPVPLAVGTRLATGLAGRPPDLTLDSRGDVAASLRVSDLLVIATRVDAGSVDPDLLDVLSEPDLLDGCVVFVAAVGPWPAEVGTADRVILPLLRGGGCTPVAPTMHVVDAHAAPIDAYCRYWGPLVGALPARRGGRSAA